MKKTSRQTQAELEYNIQDCFDAIQANPDNKKVRQYLDEKEGCEKELARREHIRHYRYSLKNYMSDHLLGSSFRARRHAKNSMTAFARDRFRTACYQMFWHKIYDLV